MNLIEQVATHGISLIAGGGLVGLATSVLNARNARHQTDRSVDAQVEEHRDSLTFDLLRAAREEMSSLRAEATSLRPLMVHAAHLEEALDHLHALLHSDSDLERAAAEKRAKAFLRRMRPQVGDLRQARQVRESAETLSGIANHEGTDKEGRLARKLPASPRKKS